MTGDVSDQVLVATHILHHMSTTLDTIANSVSVSQDARSHVELNEDAKGNVHPSVKAYQGSPLTGLLEGAMATLCEAKLQLPSENTVEAWERTLAWARERLERADQAEKEAA